MEIIESHTCIDDVYMLVSMPPKLSVSDFMGYLKGESALILFENHAYPKYKYGHRIFGANGYYVSAVGRNKATIAKYIRGAGNRRIKWQTSYLSKSTKTL